MVLRERFRESDPNPSAGRETKKVAASPRTAGSQDSARKRKVNNRKPKSSVSALPQGVVRRDGLQSARRPQGGRLALRASELAAKLSRVEQELRTQAAEKSRIEQKLKESQCHYRLIAEHSLDLIKVLDLEGNILYASPSHLQVLGYNQEELTGTNLFTRLDPESLLRARSVFLEVIFGPKNQTVELSLRKKTGDWIAVEALLAPILESSGAVNRVLLSGRDISLRRNTEVALKQANQFREKVMECATNAIGALDLEGRFTLVNRRVTEITGYEAEELIGQSYDFLLCPRDRVRVQEAVTNTLAEGTPIFQFETELLRKDGAIRMISFSLAPLLVEGTISGAVGTAEDITERKLADRALRETEDLYRDLVENSGVLFGTHDAEGRVLSTIGAVAKLGGFDRPEDLVGRKISDFLAPETRDKFSAYLETVLQQGRAHGYMKVVTRGGEIRMLEYNNSVRTEGLEKPIVRCIGLDVTERMRAEKALKASEERYRQLSGRLLQLRDEESRRIARNLHDTIGPGLAALVANLAVLSKSQPGLGRKAREGISESLALAKQCARDLRTVSYLLHPPLLDEVGLASALRWYADGFARRSGVKVELDIARGLDRLPQEMETTLFRIVQESLTNIHLHSCSPSASIHLRRPASEVELEVKDKGRGMRAEVLKAVGGSASLLGVGIAGMRERVTQLGGQLEIASGKEGTTVKAVLPLHKNGC